MSRLVETIKVKDNKICNLDYHKQRIFESCLEFYGSLNSPIHFTKIKNDISKLDGSLYKLRILYDDNDFGYSLNNYKVKPIRHVKKVRVHNYKYNLKFENRTVLEKLYNKRESKDDVLIIKNGYVTDSYYANVAFQKDGLWFTPELPLLKGTKRQFLLDSELLFTKQISESEIKDFDSCRLFNAMIEFGEIEFPTSQIY